MLILYCWRKMFFLQINRQSVFVPTNYDYYSFSASIFLIIFAFRIILQTYWFLIVTESRICYWPVFISLCLKISNRSVRAIDINYNCGKWYIVQKSLISKQRFSYDLWRHYPKLTVLLLIESGTCAFAFDAIMHDKSGGLECHWSSVINVNHRRYHKALRYRHCVLWSLV